MFYLFRASTESYYQGLFIAKNVAVDAHLDSLNLYKKGPYTKEFTFCAKLLSRN